MATIPAPGVPGSPTVPARPRNLRSLQIKIVVALAVAALVAYSWVNVGGSFTELWNGFFGPRGLIRDFIPHSLPPDSSVIGDAFKASVTTLCIAVLSIFFGVLISMFLIPLAARNIAPNRLVYETTRSVLAVLRAIPELIMMLIFIVVVGITPFSAALALTFHGVGVMTKLYAEAVEEMEMAPIDALRVAGAGRLQVFLHAVLPGVRSTLVGLTLYRFDANFRSAVTLGAVGGGGIGFLIDNAVNVYEFKVLSTYIIIMVIWVLAIERVSTVLRARLT